MSLFKYIENIYSHNFLIIIINCFYDSVNKYENDHPDIDECLLLKLNVVFVKSAEPMLLERPFVDALIT